MVDQRQKTIVLTLALMLAFYTVLLPAWLESRRAYGELVTDIASRCFPLLRIAGSVRAEGKSTITSTYIMRDPQSGGFGMVKQRLLSVPDLPLGVAASLGMAFLPWVRRLILVPLTTLWILLLHVGLTCLTALRIAMILGGPRRSPSELNGSLANAVEAIARYRDVSPVLILLLVGAMCVLVRPKLESSGRCLSSPCPRRRASLSKTRETIWFPIKGPYIKLKSRVHRRFWQ